MPGKYPTTEIQPTQKHPLLMSNAWKVLEGGQGREGLVFCCCYCVLIFKL